ncbi:MAG: hypothetical protein EP329_10200 [Deltaproteobacteria bacterium]|nr:MAG: hypothetical protein EP329_10200 [Deltaproteobacteria bacterium]
MRALLCIGVAALLTTVTTGCGDDGPRAGDTVSVDDTALSDTGLTADSVATDTDADADTADEDTAPAVDTASQDTATPADTLPGDPDTADAADAADTTAADTGPPPEDCANGVDDDGDGDVDCRDYDCIADPRCDESDHVVYGAGSCRPSDGHDDDGDGLTDCADPDCASEAGCDEGDTQVYPNGCAPDDPVDDDGDGLTSCADPDCEGAPGCDEGNVANYPSGCATDDGVDDDGDGLTDCADPDCDDAPGCDEADDASYPGGCADLADNDGDGLTDCDDPDCHPTPACLGGGDTCEEPYELLLDTPFSGDTRYHQASWGFERGRCPGRDDGITAPPAEGARDAVHRFVAPAAAAYAFKVHGQYAPALYVATSCEDIDHTCLGARSGADWLVLPLAAGEAVYVFVDNIADYAFFFPNEGPYTLEVKVAEPGAFELACADAVDDDGDGDTDCDDRDCVTAAACAEICDNGEDDDGDERVDCDDFVCLHQPACNEGVDDGVGCDNGEDDDHDGLADCYDPDCEATAACPALLGGACDTAITVDAVPAALVTDTCPYGDDFRTLWGAPGCETQLDPFAVGRDVVIRFVAPAAGDYLLRGDDNVDKSIWGGWLPHVNIVDGAAGCPARDFSSCLAHFDFFGFDVIDRVVVTATAPGDTFYIVVDSDRTTCDRFGFYVTPWAPEAGRCADGVDDDGDGATDCRDADCAGDPACDEAGTSPATRCGNGLDDEGDGLTDCDDLDCRRADPSGCGVPEGDLCATATLANAVPFSVDVSTCALTDTARGTRGDRCVWSYTGQELIVRFEAPAAGWYSAGVALASGANATLDLLDEAQGCPAGVYGHCLAGAEGAGAARVAFYAEADEVFFLVAGPVSDACTELSLDIVATSGEDTRAACSDGVDNDGDGATDAEDWRDCSGPLSEAASGPGACHDATDNDGNHKADCEDGSCIAAGEVCPLVFPGDSCADPIPLAADTPTDVDLCLRRDVFTAHAGSGCGPTLAEDYRSDAVMRFVAPATASYRLDVRWSSPKGMVNVRSEAQGCTDGHFETCLGTVSYFNGQDRQVATFDATHGEVFYLVLDSPNDTCATASVAVSIVRADEVGRCGDGLDNDVDGRADCVDPDCADEPACDEAAVGGCGNGVDDDGDGMTDCRDRDCLAAAGCDEAAAGDGACGDGVDDDGDGRTDCDDAQCRLAEGAGCGAPPAGDLCGAPIEVPALPFVDATRTTCAFTTDYEAATGSGCVVGERGPDVVYRVVPDFTGVLGVTLSALSEPAVETSLEVTTSCTERNVIDRCVVGISGGGLFASAVTVRGVPVTAGGPIYIHVGHHEADVCGAFQLELREAP